MEVKRRKFQGVLNILSFNRHFYIIGLLMLGAIITGLVVFKVPAIWTWIIIGAFLYGLVMPLIVSAYVYDFSGYYDFKWLKNLHLIEKKPKQLVNINAGFDETSFILKNNFPESDLKVFDFYNAEQHTEPAIVRARKVSLVYPNTRQIASDKIPLEDKSVDAVFLLSALHEIRSHKEKVLFLKECHRICKADGKIITVEHLRDVPNFFAFSVGFTHFFSRNAWKKAFKEAGFSSFGEKKFTPFMSIFTCCP
ncbi:methyltransferase domain-containing protein [Maribacter sp. 2210JD10-5]|uniref:class I SAM-dependent methyltransferase n=1 Tax=Maribacter sp. 2210JD10-5 TaxID=3386272 RepID=UPI0039BCA0E8